jgi:hypothetical protein
MSGDQLADFVEAALVGFEVYQARAEVVATQEHPELSREMISRSSNRSDSYRLIHHSCRSTLPRSYLWRRYDHLIAPLIVHQEWTFTGVVW